MFVVMNEIFSVSISEEIKARREASVCSTQSRNPHKREPFFAGFDKFLFFCLLPSCDLSFIFFYFGYPYINLF